jgi:Ca-activated chloride channel family protein
MLIFGYPWMFMILPLPLLLRRLLPAYGEQRPAVRLPFYQMLTGALGVRPAGRAVVRRRSLIQVLLFIVIWCLAVAALARPQWLEPPVVRELPTRDLLLAVDLSGSMEAQDFKNQEGRKVDRLTAVKEVLDDFLTRRKGDRVGLLVFGTAAFVQVPFTQDLGVCRQLLGETAVRMAGPKTAFGDAIGLGITLFERSEIEQRILIALTDGNDTGSRVPPHEAARIAADKGIIIYTVAIGDPSAVGEEKLDEEALKQVAEISNGKYFFAADREQLEKIYTELDRLTTCKVETVSYRPRLDLFHWPLAAIAVLFLGYHLMMFAKSSVFQDKN